MPEPMYRKIAEDIRQRIESGEFEGGVQLPTEVQLRERYDNASRNTVRDAIKWLVRRGLVETRPGHGTFVVEKNDPLVTRLDVTIGFGDEGSTAYASAVTAERRRPRVSAPRVELHRAGDAKVSELQLEPDTTVVSRNQRRYIDDKPWSLQTSYYPMRFVEDGASELLKAAEMSSGAVRYLQEVLGVKQAGWRDKITVRAPDRVETTFFMLPDDGRVAMFELRWTAFDESGKPLRLTVSVFPADRNQFVLSSGDVPAEVAMGAESQSAEPTATPLAVADGRGSSAVS